MKNSEVVAYLHEAIVEGGHGVFLFTGSGVCTTLHDKTKHIYTFGNEGLLARYNEETEWVVFNGAENGQRIPDKEIPDVTLHGWKAVYDEQSGLQRVYTRYNDQLSPESEPVTLMVSFGVMEKARRYIIQVVPEGSTLYIDP